MAEQDRLERIRLWAEGAAERTDEHGGYARDAVYLLDRIAELERVLALARAGSDNAQERYLSSFREAESWRTRAERAEAREARLREALHQIAFGVFTREWSPSSNQKSEIARAALDEKKDGNTAKTDP